MPRLLVCSYLIGLTACSSDTSGALDAVTVAIDQVGTIQCVPGIVTAWRCASSVTPTVTGAPATGVDRIDAILVVGQPPSPDLRLEGSIPFPGNGAHMIAIVGDVADCAPTAVAATISVSVEGDGGNVLETLDTVVNRTCQ